MGTQQQLNYTDALRSIENDPQDDDTNLDNATGHKLATFSKKDEIELFCECVSESDMQQFEDVLSLIIAGLTDETHEHDAEIGAWLRERVSEYLRPVVVKDYERESEARCWNKDDRKADLGDMKRMQAKEDELLREAA